MFRVRNSEQKSISFSEQNGGSGKFQYLCDSNLVIYTHTEGHKKICYRLCMQFAQALIQCVTCKRHTLISLKVRRIAALRVAAALLVG